MPRCIICDYCSELDSNDSREFTWKEEENGYVCKACQGIIDLSLDDFFIDEDSDLGGDVLLEDTDVEILTNST